MGYLDSLVERIEELKRRRNAVILAHNYQLPEVQDIADYVGDSLELARKAMEASADVIVMAGVRFMAETAAILNPDKAVLHPSPEAGCPLASFLSVDVIKRYREKYPGRPLVVYVNSYAEAKYYADYIVTSASAARLVSRLEEEEVLFAPDRNLASYVAEVAGKRVIPVPVGGHCPVHEYLVNEYYVRRALEEHPGAKLLVHPEAPPAARRLADFVGSTSQMLRAIGELGGDEFLLGTEEGLVHRARRLYPGKRVYPVNPGAVCIDMKKITLQNIAHALENMKPVVRVDESIAGRVREVLERSLELVR
ncbi:quinolinate synthase A [Pyrodictium occultum]|uniref:Quinolinate synthase n=1 Tax=Pyrodictium occultum TaxID=2309 RepID=A0A0V8RUT3_PYROC|nr:quinolinate synthase NadA [Pyrodictium occultum]KSW11819.1 quinolinate synthase A [Pyrodictium occultum]